jgi:hypothetical protein
VCGGVGVGVGGLGRQALPISAYACSCPHLPLGRCHPAGAVGAVGAVAQEARWKRACASIFSPPLPCRPDMQLMRSAHKTAQTAPPRARAHMPMPAHVRTGSEESDDMRVMISFLVK